MNTGQTITLGLAAGLVLASLWKDQDLQKVWSTLTTNTGADQLVPELKVIGVDLLFLIVIVWLAGISPDFSKITGALLVGLWILFLMHAKGK